MIGSCFMVLGENKHWILIIHILMDINECQDQTFAPRSNTYVCDNNGRYLYLLGINALVNSHILKLKCSLSVIHQHALDRKL